MLTQPRDGYSIRFVGRLRRRPPVPARIARAADNTWATARTELSSRQMKNTARSNGAAREAGQFVLAGVRRRYSVW
jgi:hypothetical protein